MEPSELLKKANRDLKASRYREVIRLLEPKIFLFTNDSQFYYLLGSACYFTGDIQGAQLYLQKGLSCAEDRIDIRLLLACASLRRRDTASAIQLWLEIDDLEPGNKKAKQGIKRLKLISDNKALSKLIASPQFKQLLPLKPLSSLAIILHTLLYSVVILTFLLVIGFLSIRIFRQLVPEQTFSRDGVSNEFNFFQAMPDLLANEPLDAIFTLSEAEILAAMQRARDYFNDYQDDRAGRELNRIMLSNASMAAKNQALLLSDALQTPSFATYNADFTFAEVASQPQLYHGLHVLWRGPITGLNITPDRIAFRLLVGYDQGRVLEGAVEVLVPFEVYLVETLITHVLGRVVADNHGNFFLEAISLNQVVQLQ